MNKELFLSLISLGLISFLCVLIETSLNVTFPFLTKFYGIDINTASLLTSMFLLGITILMPLSSYIVYRFNTKLVFIIITLLFTISLLACVVFEIFYILVIARFLQGIAAGIALPLMFNIVILKAPKKYFGFLMGFCVFLVGCAPGLGPVYGGYIMQNASFDYIFLCLIPFIIIAFLIGIFSITNLQNKALARFDFLEYLLIIIFIASLIISIEKLYFLGFLALFAVILSKKSEIFKSALNVSFLSGAFVIFFTMFSLLSFSLLLPNYLINILKLDNFSAGFSMLIGCIISAILAPLSGYLSDRFGSFKLSFSGVIFLVISILLFLNLEKSLYNFSLSYIVYAFGQGLSISALMSHIIKNSTNQTNANAFLNTFQQCSGVVGVMVISKIFNNDYFIGFTNALTLLLVLNSISIFLVLIAFKKYGNKFQ